MGFLLKEDIYDIHYLERLSHVESVLGCNSKVIKCRKKIPKFITIRALFCTSKYRTLKMNNI